MGSFQSQVESNQRLFWLGPLLGYDMPKEVVTTEDRIALLLNWTPLGLVPIAILINLLLHYLHFRNLPISLVVFSGIPVAAAGGMIAVAVMGVDMNTAMWVGFIALFGLAADDGIVMATYMRDTLKRRTILNVDDIRTAIYEAGLKRVRPCMMTTITTLAALVPVLISTGRGADVARDGVAGLRRNADRTVYDIHRADALLRLHRIQDASRNAG